MYEVSVLCEDHSDQTGEKRKLLADDDENDDDEKKYWWWRISCQKNFTNLQTKAKDNAYAFRRKFASVQSEEEKTKTMFLTLSPDEKQMFHWKLDWFQLKTLKTKGSFNWKQTLY